jgi:hypothetical protein
MSSPWGLNQSMFGFILSRYFEACIFLTILANFIVYSSADNSMLSKLTCAVPFAIARV